MSRSLHQCMVADGRPGVNSTGEHFPRTTATRGKVFKLNLHANTMEDAAGETMLTFAPDLPADLLQAFETHLNYDYKSPW